MSLIVSVSDDDRKAKYFYRFQKYWRTFRLIICALTCASIMWLFLISPTRNMRHGCPSLWQITAFLENSNVCVLFLGLESFANTIPTINACKITPVIDWMHITNIASGHSSVVCFEPYLRTKKYYRIQKLSRSLKNKCMINITVEILRI